MQLGQCLTRTVGTNLTFSKTNNPSRTNDAVHFKKKIGPFPVPYKTDPKSQVDQVKRVLRKFQLPQSIHDLKFNTGFESLRFCLSTKILNHHPIDVNPYQGHFRVGLGSFYHPLCSATSNLEDTTKDTWVRLF